MWSNRGVSWSQDPLNSRLKRAKVRDGLVEASSVRAHCL